MRRALRVPENSLMRLSHVLLYVKNLPRMARFYGSLLRSEPSHAEDRYVEFENGNFRLALHAIPTEIADEVEVATPPHPRETTPIRLAFLTDGLDAESLRLRELGATLERRPWGGFVAIDPEGNIFEIVVQ